MLNFTEYRLHFHGPLHIAPDTLGHAAACPLVHSDQLYRALLHAHAELFGRPVEKALSGWPDAPAVRVSSALPYTSEHGALMLNPEGVLIQRDAPGAVAVAANLHWAVSSRVRSPINRLSTRRGARFTTAEIRFAEGAGLWLGARFLNDKARQEFDAALRYLGDCGLAGGRSVGGGAFAIAQAAEIAAPAGDAKRLLCLSRFCPTDGEFAAGALLKSPAQAHFSRQESKARDKELRFIAEGSTVAAHPALNAAQAGRCVALPGSSPRGGFLFAWPLA